MKLPWICNAGLLLSLCLTLADAHPQEPDAQLDREAMQVEMNRLAAICERLELHAEAAVCSTWLAPQRLDQTNLYLPVPFPEPQAGNAAHGHWCNAFSTARRRHAQWLFAEARRSVANDDELSAFRLLWHVLREDPEHVEARRILGPLADAAEVRPRVRSSASVQSDFGWPARSYSRIQTPHFLLTTRADTRESIAIAKQLEAAHALWSQLFFDLWAPKGLLASKFAGENQSWRESRKMEVYLLADRQDYLETLGASEENIGASVGYYSPDAKKSFFYPSDTLEATFFHELTHQLFSESSQMEVVPKLGSSGGVWLLEGVAVYMESLRQHEHFWTAGGIEATRIQTSRYRAVRDGFWPDWQAFAGGSIDDWKSDPQLAMYYAHAAGLTHVFLDLLPERLESRQSYLDALAGVYRGRSDAGIELRSKLGPDEEQAKIAYQDLLTLTDNQIAELVESGFRPRDLVLAGSQLKSESWQLLASQTELRWLDVSFSNATNADLDWVEQLAQLERLSVEGTSIDGKFLPRIASLRNLDELDLSGCAIDDQALEALRGNASIQILWLTQTQVTDACLKTLASMRRLRQCDVGGTRIEKSSWDKFQAQHLRAKP